MTAGQEAIRWLRSYFLNFGFGFCVAVIYLTTKITIEDIYETRDKAGLGDCCRMRFFHTHTRYLSHLGYEHTMVALVSGRNLHSDYFPQPSTQPLGIFRWNRYFRILEHG